MRINSRKAAGILAIAGALFFIAAMLASEALYPHYSWAANYISDLGVGSTAPLFNSAAMLFGGLIVIVAVLVLISTKYKLLSLLMAIAGAGIIGVGAMPETTGIWHTAFAGIAFGVGALSAIASSKLFNKPVKYFFVLLGIVSLAGIGCYQLGFYFGLGPGGMERVVAFPILLWIIIFGFLLTTTESQSLA